jgi:hypothetical protein
MTDVRKLFADLTGAIEDLHGIAVEGQAPNLSPDIQLCLLGAIGASLNSMCSLVKRITNTVPDRQP